MSTEAVEDVLRERLLTFPRLNGDSLDTLLGADPEGSGEDGRLYWDKVPDHVTSPYAVMSLRNRRRDMENPERELAELELQLFVRNWANRSTVTEAADAADEAMRGFRHVSEAAGFVGVIGASRSAMGPWREPADADVVQILCVYTLVLWPAHLIQYHNS